MPKPVEALPWGSKSSSSTFLPLAASAVARLIAVVVLPTPPFWLATASTRRGACSSGIAVASMAEGLHAQNDALWAGAARLCRDGHCPLPPRLGQFFWRRFALEEQADGPFFEEGRGELQQARQRGQGARRHDIDGKGRQRLDAAIMDCRRRRGDPG